MVFCTEYVDGWWSWEPLHMSCVRCRWCHAPSAPYTRPTQRLSRPSPIQKLGAENHMLRLSIWCSWWWVYVPEACRARNIQGDAKRTHVFEMGSSRESFFLWGYLKSKVYIRKPRTVDNLKVSIRKEIATVPQEMLINVMQNFEERLRTCVRQEGRHLSDIIFRNWVINVSNQNCIYYMLFWC